MAAGDWTDGSPAARPSTGSRLVIAAVLVSMLVGGVGLVGIASPASADHGPSRPTVTEPPNGLRGHPLWDSYFELAGFGYTQAEYFVRGTATDSAGNTADYTTRIIVTHPIDPADFNGAVLLDWVNVTAQYENPVTTILGDEFLLREGWAYVHVSAQAAGICCAPPQSLKTWDTVRYADLDHPGDQFSFDLFSQIAALFRDQPPSGVIDPMGPLGVGSVEVVVAAGQSQGAIRLHDYINTWLPDHPEQQTAVDAFLLHGNIGQPKSFDVPVHAPVLNMLSDAEAVDDGVVLDDLGPNVRVWEVAGAAHVNYWIAYMQGNASGPRSGGNPQVSGEQRSAIIEAAGNYGEVLTPDLAVCFAGGTAYPMRYTNAAALFELNRWARGGDPPAHSPRYEFSGGLLARDADGNALGGLRLPPVDVPVASYRSTECGLTGFTIPFLDEQLVDRYGDHETYMQLMSDRTDEAVRSGWILPADASDLMLRACNASVRWGSEPTCDDYVPPSFRSTPDSSSTGAATDAAAAPQTQGADVPRRRPLPATGGQGITLELILALGAGTLFLAVGSRFRVTPFPKPRSGGPFRHSAHENGYQNGVGRVRGR